MDRCDRDLAFMLQYENIAWYEAGAVRILDRRVYPRKVEFVTCRSHVEVAQAIRDMVTQSAGPYTAAAMGMALAAYECRDRGAEGQLQHLKEAAAAIAGARPTTRSRMQLICESCLGAAERAIAAGEDLCSAIRDHAIFENNTRYERIGRTAQYLVDKFPDKGSIMTQCFGETIVGQMLGRPATGQGHPHLLSGDPSLFPGRQAHRHGVPRHGLRRYRHHRQHARLRQRKRRRSTSSPRQRTPSAWTGTW